MELAAKLTDKHLEAAGKLLKQGKPEYVVSAKLGIPYMTWKYWKRAAKKIMDTVQQEVEYLYNEGFLAKDGTPLGFVIIDDTGNALSRHETNEDARKTKKKLLEENSLGKVKILMSYSIEDERKEVQELIRIKTELKSDQIKVVTLLTYCKEGKAYAISDHIDNIESAGKSSWQASAWWLERADRENFGKNETIEHKGGIGIASIELSKEENDQYKENLASIFGNLKGANDE